MAADTVDEALDNLICDWTFVLLLLLMNLP